MAKITGLGNRFFYNAADVGGDINSLRRLGGGPALLDGYQGLGKLAIERRCGLRTGTMEWLALFNPTGIHTVLANLSLSDQIGTYAIGSTIGDEAASMVSKQLNYDGTREDNGQLRYTTTLESNGFGIEWGNLLTAGMTQQTGPAALSGFDLSINGVPGSTAFGFQWYLHVLARTGSSTVINIQHSDDNAVGDPYTTVSTLTPVAIGSSRTAVASPTVLKRWVRVQTTGTFTVLDFVVNVVRNYTLPEF